MGELGRSGAVPLAQLSPPWPPGPQCYTCQSLHKGESCEQVPELRAPQGVQAIVSSWTLVRSHPGVAGRASPKPVRGPIPAVSRPVSPLSPSQSQVPDHLLGSVCRHMSSHQQDGGRIPDDHILLPVQPVQHPTPGKIPGRGQVAPGGALRL